MGEKRFEIPIGNGKFLVAEAGGDPNYPREIFIKKKKGKENEKS